MHDVNLGHLSVAILLGTKDGAKHLGEQLKSYLEQTHSNWSLHLSDDGSLDETIPIVESFARSCEQTVTMRKGPQRGFSENFMSLARDGSIVADYYAFSDQDDIWCKDKLERAIRVLVEIPDSVPAIFCSRTETVDEMGAHLGFSPLFSKKPSFQNALVQNIGGGNTMVFNTAAKRLLESASTCEVVSHDWWAYQLVAGAGGIVHYSVEPTVKYRQHSQNIVGSNTGLRARLRRLAQLSKGRLKSWNEINIGSLQSRRELLSNESAETVDQFLLARTASWFLVRLWKLHKSRVYRQTIVGNLGLLLATIVRKI